MINIGTCIKGENFYTAINEIAGNGFDSVQMYFPGSLNGFDIDDYERINNALEENNIKMNSVGLYCNPIESEESRKEIIRCLKNASKLKIEVFSTFTGAVSNAPVEETLPLFKKYFSEFLTIAKDNNVKIAIENYPNYGFWYGANTNIGFCPRAWELMFNEIDDPFIGLEWEPSHQIDQFIEPIPQLERWIDKVIHIHGKDASIDKQKLQEVGILSCIDFSSHRFPGFGDTNWNEIFRILKKRKYKGTITIEGFHDPVYNGAKEMDGQLLALNYLRDCRDN